MNADNQKSLSLIKFYDMEKQNNCVEHLDYPDRGSYKKKWIIRTIVIISIPYMILWYLFPRIIEKRIYPTPITELVCGEKEKIVEYVASDCTPHTK